MRTKSENIQRFVEKRGIKHLFHFTRTENLASIEKHGLLGRNTLKEEGVRPSVNASFRLDRAPNSICCSISYPNEKMFYLVRKNDEQMEWAVLLLKVEILWTKECVFCIENAAKKEIANSDVEERKKFSGLNAMFGREVDGKSRKGLTCEYPTNVQAEVLVLGGIETNLIEKERFIEKGADSTKKYFCSRSHYLKG